MLSCTCQLHNSFQPRVTLPLAIGGPEVCRVLVGEILFLWGATAASAAGPTVTVSPTTPRTRGGEQGSLEQIEGTRCPVQQQKIIGISTSGLSKCTIAHNMLGEVSLCAFAALTEHQKSTCGGVCVAFWNVSLPSCLLLWAFYTSSLGNSSVRQP